MSCRHHRMPVPDGVTTEVVQLPFREGGLSSQIGASGLLVAGHARAPKVCTQLFRELEGPPSRAQCVPNTLQQWKAWARVVQILGPSLLHPAARRS